MRYTFSVLTKVKGKERPRRGKFGGMYTPRTTVAYESEIGAAFYEAYDREDVTPMTDPFWLYIDVVINPTKKSVKDGVAPKWGSPCTKKPDIDNIAKSVLDALNGILWEDDAQCAGLTISKKWGRIGESERLDIEVHNMDELWGDPDEEE